MRRHAIVAAAVLLSGCVGHGVTGPIAHERRLVELDKADLTRVRLRMSAGELEVRGGAATLLKADFAYNVPGEADVDLRGNPSESYRVQIHGGVGSATVRVPGTVAISAAASGGLGSISVSGLQQRDGRWINPRAGSSPVTIDLNVRGGIGAIKIVAD